MSKLILPALLLLASSPLPALAQGSQSEVHVSHRDLDLASAAGVAELDRRITRAIKAVCPQDNGVELSRKAVAERCHRVIAATLAGQRSQAIASTRRPGPAVAAR